MANEPKKPSFVKMRDVFQDKKNPKNPSLVENKDNYADTKKPFPEDLEKNPSENSVNEKEENMENSVKAHLAYLAGENSKTAASDLERKEHLQKKLEAVKSKRNWESLPSSFEVDAVNAFKKEIKPYLSKDSSLIKFNVALNRATSFEDIENAFELWGSKTASKKEAGPLLDRLQKQEGEGQSQIQQTLSQLKSAFDKFRSLVFEVPATGQVIEAAKSGEGVDLKIYPDKDSPTPSTEKKFDLNSFVNFFFQKIAPQNAEKVLSEILSKGFSSIAKPVFARVCASMQKKAADVGYVEKAPYYLPDLDENGNELPTGELSEEPMFLVNKTYEVITPESAERGFEFEDAKYSPADLASEIRNQGYSEWSNSDKTGWITAYDEEGDYRTGERTNYSLHIKKLDGSELSDEDYAFIDHLMKK